MTSLARTTRIYHDNLVSLVGFQQLGEVTGARAKIDDGIKLPFDVLYDEPTVSLFSYGASCLETHQQTLHHPVCNFVSDIVNCSTLFPSVSTGSAILLCSFRGAVKHAVHRGVGRCERGYRSKCTGRTAGQRAATGDAKRHRIVGKHDITHISSKGL